MSGEVETEAPRPRPLSGGLWTLFSWLRRDDGGSSDSLSSAGSDRSVASFAFLPPARCRLSAPLPLPPPGPPTDSYKKRVHDRNLRRQHDRDLTLHRKYGLYRGDGAVGYDVASLPSARRTAHSNIDQQERERRAISESLQRRTPYVPGKRRAPLPPGRPDTAGTSATLPHRHSRKRRAPQPPIKFKEKTKENEVRYTEMNLRPSGSKNTSPVDVSMGCKPEKYVKKEQHTKTDTKSRQDKSFLKQIFDNKRRSAIDTSSIKILPSISELDRQAVELIETCKLKEREQNNNVLNMDQNRDIQNSDISKRPHWICITCLRRFDVSVNRCSFCITNQKPINSIVKETNKNENICTQTDKDLPVLRAQKNLDDDERQQLKKMLKEMKDSLPKKNKPAEDIVKNDEAGTSASFIKVYVTETPTLRIGSSIQQETNLSALKESSQAEHDSKNLPKRENTNEIVRKILLHENVKKTTNDLQRDRLAEGINHNNFRIKLDNNTKKNESESLSANKRLNTPLKISSLLNPVYIPKQRAAQIPNNPLKLTKKEDIIRIDLKMNDNVKPNEMTSQIKTPFTHGPSTSDILKTEIQNRDTVNTVAKKILPPKKIAEPLKIGKTTVSTESQTSSANQKSVTTKVDEINQHSRRRDLINQLEKSIAEGDERAAADAAAKLAQLRLSCSVLSFTSQILGQLSNHEGVMQKATVRDENKIQQSEPQVAQNKSVTKTIAAPTSSKNLQNIIHRKQDAENETPKKRADEYEQSCSKSTVENVNDIKPLPTHVSSLTSQQGARVDGSNIVTISVWIEDKDAARGPIKLQISRLARLGCLRRLASARLGIAGRLQRWIVGRALCVRDDTPLAALAGPDLTAPFYLCLVEFDPRQKSASPNKDGSKNVTRKNSDSSDNAPKSDNDNAGDVYTELMQLERQALVSNGDAFECQVCMEHCEAGRGAVLRECVHSFCRDCLGDMIRHCEEPAVPCPAMGCPGTLHEREVRALVSGAEYERWLARGLAAAERRSRNAFHCRTRDCAGWALCEAGVRRFPCPVCKRENCVPCQAIHDGDTCEQYRTKLQQATVKVATQTDEGTKALLDSLIARGEALECPECSAIITKKWGCDWVKCSACKTEICWVTRGRRWGPAGRGDTSAGCRCGVDGKRCHPSCGYCH